MKRFRNVNFRASIHVLYNNNRGAEKIHHNMVEIAQANECMYGSLII